MLLQIVLVACFIIIGSEGGTIRGDLKCYTCDEGTDCVKEVGRLVYCTTLKYDLIGFPLKGGLLDTVWGTLNSFAGMVLKDRMHCVHFGLTSRLQVRSCFASKLPFDIPRILSMFPMFHGVAQVCTTNGCNNRTFVTDIPKYEPPKNAIDGSVGESEPGCRCRCRCRDEEHHRAYNFANSLHFNSFHLFGWLCELIVIRMVHAFNCL